MEKKVLSFLIALLLKAGPAGAATAEETLYPDADVLVLDDVEDVAYRPDGTARSTSEQRIKILTEKGRREERVISFGYSARYEKARLVEVTVTGTNGVERAVEIAATTKESTDNASMSENIYDPMDRKVTCTVPDLKIGEILKFRIARETHQARIANQWANLYVFEWKCPILRATVRVRAPKELPLAKALVRHPLGNIVESRQALDDGSVLHTWTATNSPQAFPEPDMPPLYTQVQHLQLTTAESWQAISRWYWRLCQPHFAKAHAAITNKVAELTGSVPAGDRSARLRAIYRWVAQEVRYMGLTMEDTSPGYAPHDVDVTFDNRYGVCRDKAGLLAVMLRIAGFDAYPVLIHAGTKKDPDVPTPFFNHAIVAVAEGPGDYTLMDPTDESSRDLLPAYLSNCSYLVARPEGETLRLTPMPPAEQNKLAIRSEGTLSEDGSLLLDQRLSFGGINDNAYRRALLRREPADRRKLFEAILRERFGGVELLSCEIQPLDLQDTRRPLTVRLLSRVKEAIVRGESRIECDSPFVSPSFGVANWLLSGSTSLEKRRYPLQLTATACVEETLALRLDEQIGPLLRLPEEVSLKGKYAYERDGYLQEEGRKLVLRRLLSVNSTEFSPAEYAQLRAAVQRVEAAERDRPVFARSLTANAPVHYLRRAHEVDFSGPYAWTVTNTVVKRILTYEGKKSSSELVFSYHPAWERLEVLAAVVISPDGKRTAAGEKETNEMDCAWASAAPRYPAARQLIVNLPAVEVGSVISSVVVRTVSGAPASFYGLWYLDGASPIDEMLVRVGEKRRLVRNCWPRPAEAMAPSGLLWREHVLVSSNSFATAAARLRPAFDVAPLARADIGGTVQEIRDWMARNVRVAGPSLYDLPLERQLTSPAVVLKERTASRLDYVRTLCALLRGAGHDADLVVAADDAAETPQARRKMQVDAPDVRAFSFPLCRVRVRSGGLFGFGGRTDEIYLGTENEHTPLGTSPYEGATAFDPRTETFFRIAVAEEALRSRAESVWQMSVRENGGVDIDVTERLWGAEVGTFRKRYAEMLPEERQRHYQSILGGISQGASATRELVTDVAAYPAVRSYSCFAPAYATVTPTSLSIDLSVFEQTLFPLTGNVRTAPLEVGACEAHRLVCSVTFPPGYDCIEHLPQPYVFANPADASVWYGLRAETRRGPAGQLTVDVVRTRSPRPSSLLSPVYFALLKDWNRLATSKSNRTIILRRGKDR